MTIFFASHEIQIYRSRHQGNNKYTYSATFTAYQADIQPAGQDRVELVQGRIGKTFTAFLEASVDVQEGDIIVTGGKRYGVRGVSRWEGAGLLDHLELILVAQDA